MRKLNTRQKKLIAIFMKAADHILKTQGHSCCHAIGQCNDWPDAEMADDIMYELYKHDSDRQWSAYWWDLDAVEARIAALLLAAEWVRTESQ